VWERCLTAGVAVVVHGDPDYPAVLLDDPLPPPVLFARGDLSLVGGRRAGIVGTRNATSAGRDAAGRLGEGLGRAGVHVVSGLARGVDGHAHRGVLRAGGPGRPIGVVASGLDVVYPREHADLWAEVGTGGLLLSESPPGTAPEAFRFPLRNRIIAALSEVVVVVESRERGGSLITCTEAAERGIPLMAVPGGVHNRAASGSNNLLREGAATAVDASDVLIALSLDHRRSTAVVAEQRPRPRRDDLPVYAACAAEPRTIDGIVLATGLSLVEAAMAVARLEQAGWLGQADGWFETIGAPLR
jgi:DNA processing protein